MDVQAKKELKRLQKDKLRAQSNGSLKQEAEACNAIGQLLVTHGEYESALQEHIHELQLSESLKDVIGSAVANRLIGECYCEMGRYTKALKYQQNHLEKARSVNNDVEEQRALATIGRTYLLQSDTLVDKTVSLDKSHDAFQGSLDICRRLGGKVSDRELAEMKARLYLNLGLVYDFRQNADSCAKFIKQAVYIAEQKNLHEDLYRAKLSLAGIYLRDNRFSQAQRMYEGALQVAKKLSDKYMESECMAGSANMYLQMGDFSAACKYFKQAYKLGSQRHSEREAVTSNFKAAIRGRRLLKDLNMKAEDDVEGRLAIYESLGDLFCKLVNYTKAISYYEKQAGRTWLNIAKAQEDGGKHFALINSCLEKAMEQAQKAGHPRLQLRVLKVSAVIQEKFVEDVLLEQTQQLIHKVKSKYDLDSDDDEISDDESQETQNVEEESLQFTESEESEVDENDIVEGVRKRNKKPHFMRRNEKGETPLHRACIEGNVTQVKKYLEQGHPVNPRDYCGWTPLHESCNHGHYEVVELLLDHKANINDPGGDLCGKVTPLHDAINCGHFKVAQLLIRRGANVHAVDAEGQTPLKALYAWEANYKHDLDREARAACGHLKRIIHEVVKNGFSNGPMQTHTFDSDLFSADEDSDPRQMVSQGQTQTSVSDSMSPTQPPNRIRLSRSANRRISNQRRITAIEDSELDFEDLQGDVRMEEEVAMLSNDDFDNGSNELLVNNNGLSPARILENPEDVSDPSSPTPPIFDDDPDDVCNAYQQAITAVGSASSIMSQKKTSHREPTQSNNKQSALIPDETYTGGDDWLIDDMGIQPGKRKRNLESASNRFEMMRGGQKTTPQSVRSTRPPSSKRRRTKQLRLTSLQLTRERVPVTIDSDDSSVTSQEEIQSEQLHREPNFETSFTQQSTVPQVTHGGDLRRPPMRVRVRVKDKTLAIPVPGSDKTMQWLTDQACQRYFNMFGVRPTLILQTPEGAIFADEDIVTDSVSHNEEIIALVDTWDLPPLHQRYQRACKTAKTDANQKIINAMQLCETSLILSLANLGLGTTDIKPVISALQLQESLRYLHLHGNTISDAILQSFSEAATMLPNLVLLDLSCNYITHEGLRFVSDNLKKNATSCDHVNAKDTASLGSTRQKPFQLLEELNLSFNSLTDDSSLDLAHVIECCPRLVNLKFQSCDFTMKLFRREFNEALKALRRLESIDLSHNTIGCTGVELLLKSLPHTSLKKLDLASVIQTSHGNTVALQFSRYLTLADCCLETLCLRDCYLTDEDVTTIARSMNSSTMLSSLDVSANSDITLLALQELLSTIHTHKLIIKKIDFSACHISSVSDTLADALVLLISEKLIAEVILNGCGLKREDQSRIRQMSAQNNKILCSVQNQICELYIT
ncbi:tonsoku-like protein isoform X2 [Anneissia japonica]|uniref:tonsoku-like protein isoform X2 n=1 Tax=Anneissia japonica TaxID=1529436 RepID=UPI001425B162|nr:tonsoku-like protein isoform X2 [Anneissia japonica]